MAKAIQGGSLALQRERVVIMQRIEALNACGHEIDRLVGVLDRLASRLPTGPEALLLPRTGANARASITGKRIPRGALRNGILEILAGQRAIHLTQILETLAAAGLTPHSTNPRGSVQTTLFALAREGLTVNHGRNIWALVKRRSSKAVATTR